MIDHQLEFSREIGLDRSGDSLGGFTRLGEYEKSSSPGEFHPQALTEPDGNLSAHPALIAQPQDKFRVTIKRTCGVHVGPPGLTSELPAVDGNEIV